LYESSSDRLDKNDSALADSVRGLADETLVNWTYN